MDDKSVRNINIDYHIKRKRVLTYKETSPTNVNNKRKNSGPTAPSAIKRYTVYLRNNYVISTLSE